MILKDNLQYTTSHEWVEFLDEHTARVGLTDFAQSELGDLVFVNLPEIGDELEKEAPLGDVESVKAVSDIFSPFTGVVNDINEEVLDAPESINAQPYETWLVEIGEITAQEELLTAAAYEEFCKTEKE